MKVKVLTLSLLMCSLGASADEGMWLLPDLKTQNAATMLELGLEIPIEEVYSENSISLKDAVIQFGRGCTGEVVSSKGLVFTNHHCGYGAIQKLSSVENDYLTNGYWAHAYEEELPCEGLTVTFIDQILDVTEFVEAQLAKNEAEREQNFVSSQFLNECAQLFAKKQGIKITPFRQVELRPFYGGNRYMVFIKNVYHDIRLVGTPPSSIGKYGADTDNWMWPRHTGDFSVFRIYADKHGKPAEYAASNQPLQPKKHLPISLKGLAENEFAFLMGFPGSNWRYMISDEVEERMQITNFTRQTVRGKRLAALQDEMLKDDAVRIHYASKYASSANYWKNAIGMNEGLVRLNVIDTKKQQQEALLNYGQEKGDSRYLDAFNQIRSIVQKREAAKRNNEALQECFITGLDVTKVPNTSKLMRALESGKKKAIKKEISALNEKAAAYFEEVPYFDVEKRVMREMLEVYKEIIPAPNQLSLLSEQDETYGGDVEELLLDVFSNSIFTSPERYEAFAQNPTLAQLSTDPLIGFRQAVDSKRAACMDEMRQENLDYKLAHKVWVSGMMQLRQEQGIPIYPDANLTLRLTYGKAKGYEPADGIYNQHYTTLKGVMEKEDPNNWEFVVPAKLKALYEARDYGPYANEKGEMPVNFIVDTDNTGGNSGSPLMNGKGELVGIGFDRNYEGLTGDIAFRPSSQRAATVDIRYVLFIIDKFANSQHIMRELTIVE